MSHVTLPIAESVRLDVPGLIDRPVLGTGCCAMPAADLLCEWLAGLDGIRDVSCDLAHGEVEVSMAPAARQRLLPVVATLLDGLGYPIRGIRP